MVGRQAWVPRWLPLLVGFATLTIVSAGVYLAILGRTENDFAYALDDAYIHLAIAKNLLGHGIWGVTQYGFTSASSAPLWTLTVAVGYWISGGSVYAPLAINLVLGVLALFLLDKTGRILGLRVRWRTLLLVVFVLCAPFVSLAFSGMEHVLHAVLLIAFCNAFIPVLQGAPVRSRAWIAMAVLAFLATLTRYESAAWFGALMLVGLFRRDVRWAIPLLGSFAGIVAFGLYSSANGMPFIPNSIVVKSVTTEAHYFEGGLFAKVLERLQSNSLFRPFSQAITAGLLAGLAACIATSKPFRPLAVTVLIAMALQWALSGTWQLFRYEANIVILCLIGVAACLSAPWRAPAALAKVGFGILAVGLIVRVGYSLYTTPRAAMNIHDQQLQMARFVAKELPSGSTVALNDIGAVSFFSDARIIDLWGLASDEVRDLKAKGEYSTAAIASILTKSEPDAILIYLDWYNSFGGLPRQMLRPVAAWSIQDNVICGSNLVYVVAMPGHVKDLRFKAWSFSDQLPKTVEVTQM